MTTTKTAETAVGSEPEMVSQHTADLDLRARIRDVAIKQFGQSGFGTDLQVIAEAAGVTTTLVNRHFGSKEGLRKVCDDYILESIRTSKSEALQSMSPTTWFAQLAQIESYAPMMAYLIRCMESGDALGHILMQRMTDNAQDYLEEAVRAGTIKPSRDPQARAKFLAMSGGGGFLLYLRMHENPTDMEPVLRDYGRDMILPALELYTHGLLTDTTMYDAFVAQAYSQRS